MAGFCAEMLVGGGATHDINLLFLHNSEYFTNCSTLYRITHYSHEALTPHSQVQVKTLPQASPTNRVA